MKNTATLLKQLVSPIAVSGYEWELGMASTIQHWMGREGERIGNNLVYTLGEGMYEIFISAHMDEVGFIITESTKEYCRILPVGDIPVENVIGEKLIFAVNDTIQYSLPIKQASSFEDLKVLGLNKLPIGSIGTFAKKATQRKNCVYSPSLDNKSGCAVLILLYKKLMGTQLPVRVTLCFSSKEEIGVNGVMSAVRNRNPDICIDVDSAYAKSNTEFFPANWCMPLMGKGPALQLLGDEFLISDRYRRIVEKAAGDNTIPLQYEIPDSRSGGTNSKAIQNNGYETIQINIPVAGQHSAKSSVSLTDIEDAAELLFQLITKGYTLFDLT